MRHAPIYYPEHSQQAVTDTTYDPLEMTQKRQRGKKKGWCKHL